MVVETLVALPLGYAFFALAQKVTSLRDQVADQQAVILDQQRQLDVARTDNTGSSGASYGAGSVLLGAGLVASSAAVVYNIMRYQSMVPGQASDSRSPIIQAHDPPASYTPELANSESEACSVCLDYRKDTLLLPCRHTCLCWPCSQRIVRGDARCPHCREYISARSYIFW